MPTPETLLSSDSHVIEPADLWTSRASARYRDRVPHLVREADADWWTAGDTRIFSLAGGADPGVRFDHPERLRLKAKEKDVRPGAYDPIAKLADMEIDGVSGEVIYPTIGLLVYRLPSAPLLTELCRCYNDWLAEFCSADPARLKGIAMLNLDDVPSAVRELERARRDGLAGAMVTVYPPEHLPFDHAMYEPFWAAAQDLEMPISLHVGTNRRRPERRAARATATGSQIDFTPRPSLRSTLAYFAQVSLADMLFSGVFERHPRLRIVSAEHEVAWIPFFLASIDYTYTQRKPRPNWHRFQSAAIPSDFFHRNVYVSFQEDAVGMRMRDLVGVDRLMWGSDYPHQESTWPRSREILDRILHGVSPHERALIVRDTTAAVYGFAQPASIVSRKPASN